MKLLRTELEVFTDQQILKAIEDYEANHVPHLQDLWEYYVAKNPKILGRPVVDESNPDNKTVVSYGRKIITTFKGYAYRPGFISYKSENEDFLADLKLTFARSSEKVKTSRTGRNMGIFGFTYEVFFFNQEEGASAEPHWINNDPRTLILYYDHSPEPNKRLAIRLFQVADDKWRVEVMYPTEIVTFDRVRTSSTVASVTGWELENRKATPNFFGKIPVAAYYLGDEAIGIIEPVRTLIDDYDNLVSDSMIEFDKFAHAYLLMAKMSLTDSQKKESQTFSRALWSLKRKRVFERLQSTDDIKFLLKDTPVAFISWLAELVRNEIHKQSHVPDFMSEKLGGDLSGVAVARLMFDFENLVSSAEGDFNLGLMERLDLIVTAFQKAGRSAGESADIVVSHKRNVPQNVKEFAETAGLMSNAGFSRELIAEIMPDDVIPDVQAELKRQRDERANAFGDDIGELPEGGGEIDPLAAGAEADVETKALNGAQMKSMTQMVKDVVMKTVPPESAKALFLIAIPSLTEDQVNKIIDPAAAFEAPESEPPPQFGGPQSILPEPPPFGGE